MDANVCYLEMFEAMNAGDHELAREKAKALKEWLAKGGFYPTGYTKMEVFSYIQSVLRRTGGVGDDTEFEVTI